MAGGRPPCPSGGPSRSSERRAGGAEHLLPTCFHMTTILVNGNSNGYGYGDGDGYGEGFEIYPLITDDPLVALQHISL